MSILLKLIQINKGFWPAAAGKFAGKVNQWLKTSGEMAWEGENSGESWLGFYYCIFYFNYLLLFNKDKL